MNSKQNIDISTEKPIFFKIKKKTKEEVLKDSLAKVRSTDKKNKKSKIDIKGLSNKSCKVSNTTLLNEPCSSTKYQHINIKHVKQNSKSLNQNKLLEASNKKLNYEEVVKRYTPKPDEIILRNKLELISKNKKKNLGQERLKIIDKHLKESREATVNFVKIPNLVQKNNETLSTSTNASKKNSNFEKAMQNVQNISFNFQTSQKANSSFDFQSSKMKKYDCSKINEPTVIENSILDFDEEMEWEEVPEEQIINNANDTRNIYYKTLVSNLTELTQEYAQQLDKSRKNGNKIYIVIDTNVFLINVHIISKLMNLTIPGKSCINIVVPWIVLQELDFQKDGKHEGFRSLKKPAMRAIRFINDQFVQKNPQFFGESAIDAFNTIIEIKSPDDHIINCCLKYLNRDNNVVVLCTNDKNLKNKALVNQIIAFDCNSIIDGLKKEFDETQQLNKTKTLSDHTKFQIKRKTELYHSCIVILEQFFSYILEKEFQNAYGEFWSNIVSIKPPWSYERSLQCFLKYWCPVFSTIYLKNCKPRVKELLNIHNIVKIDIINLNEKEFFECLHSFCLLLKHISKDYERITKMCNEEICKINQSYSDTFIS